mmetsp:Transcript_12222/g.24608  ORF Transcript_12222/g.24608 Transcript_12222/m.24608 type:complete len:248 (-) Transcript_12222:250-993(-)
MIVAARLVLLRNVTTALGQLAFVGLFVDFLQVLVQIAGYAIEARAIHVGQTPAPRRHGPILIDAPALHVETPSGQGRATLRLVGPRGREDRWGTQGQRVDDILVVLDDRLGQRRRHDLRRGLVLQRVISLLPVLHGDVREDLREPKQRAAAALDGAEDHFDGQQCQHCEHVEHVVHRRAGEGALERDPIAGLPHGHQRVRHGGADVRAHDDGDGRLHTHLLGPHQAHDDRCARRGGLHQDGREDADH